MELDRKIQDALAEPFPDDEIEFLPRAPNNGRALALPYIDARAVMNRLDAVVGAANWSFAFDVLTPDCKRLRGILTVCGVTKCDAGEASTEDETLKSAVSDALKRAAVHFGIGRFLYDLPAIWHEYDNQKKRWASPPRLPRQQHRPRTQGQVQDRVRGVLESIPHPGPAPIVGGNGHGDDEAKRQRLRLAAVLKTADLTLDDARPIASAVLDKPVEKIGALLTDELARVVAYVEQNPSGAQAIVHCPADETLPLETGAAEPVGLQKS